MKPLSLRPTSPPLEAAVAVAVQVQRWRRLLLPLRRSSMSLPIVALETVDSGLALRLKTP